MSSTAIVNLLTRTCAVGLLLAPTIALADSCRVENSSAPGSWKFVRAYDADTGEVVLRKAINGGDSAKVTVSGTTARIEYKLAGHTRYQTAIIAACKGGNTLRT